MIFLYTQLQQGQDWLRRYQGKQGSFACILGFTATGLIRGISAAGATPQDREYTAIADAEFLLTGAQSNPQYPLPYLYTGVSPVFISRAIIESLAMPNYIFNAGLLHQPPLGTIDLGGVMANCLSSGQAMTIKNVQALFQQGWQWGEKIATTTDYLIIGECVVGGTTTALGLLMGLGIEAGGMVNSSHPQCNHAQKLSLVEEGLSKAKLIKTAQGLDPLSVVAAMGDPMQITAAGMAMAASLCGGVILAGGTQMLAVYALIKAIADYHALEVNLNEIVVGTTRWVAEDRTGNTINLARLIGGVPLLATGLNFYTSRYPSFRAYEQGYVKEGVGAGGCAISAHLSQGWTPIQLVTIIENLLFKYRNLRGNSVGQ
ncbi:nicotinate mononucleotide-dependent phosphoribosyltransferase CobT [Xenococcus sp. PCC 7305]|uniref:nicotinate mononucleotide-dependent phosphoribosyltransferase CobT n=1 Tax=Xenococcus sp. PCC 7305 TaxID=102125 RepID=UPI0002E5EF67|nr:TIGR00303 family protein [Xenococcus sp. PCC 7305]